MRALFLVSLFAVATTTVLGMPTEGRHQLQKEAAAAHPPSLRQDALKAAEHLRLRIAKQNSSPVVDTINNNNNNIDDVVVPVTYFNYMPINDGYNSNFFYMLETTLAPTKRANAPLVLWLQGGPGASSLFGAYAETGANLYKVDDKNPDGYTFEKNPFTWTKYSTMLYVDNPIGTGFSFTDNNKGFSTTDEGIATNLVTFLRNFLVRHPEYVSSPFHIFSESYGGKMAAFFGNALAKAVLVDKTFPSGFKLAGVALGDGWVDPIGCMDSYGDYLFSLGQITKAQKTQSDKIAVSAAAALAQNNGDQATNLWGQQQNYIQLATNNLNWYNSLTTFSYIPETQLDTWLQNVFPTLPEVRAIVNITSVYGAQSNTVFEMLSNAFMRDGIAEVESMLALGVSVSVYVGEVDLIVDPVCVRNWVNKMDKWAGLDDFQNQPLKPYTSTKFAYPQQVLATRQQYENLQLWTVSTAGHMVPADSPLGAEIMFASIIGAPLTELGDMSLEALYKRETQKKLSAKPIDALKRFRL